MKKRIISAAIATLMAASAFSTSAFAAGLKSDATLEAAGTVSVPVIDVTVPTSASFIINPYKMTVTKYEKDAWDTNKPSAAITSADTVIALYGPKADNSAEATGWVVSNNCETNDIDVKMYATYKAAKTVEVNAETATEGLKQLSLTLKAGDSAVNLLSAAPTAWTGDGSEGVATFTLNKKGGTTPTKELKLTGTATAGTVAWTASDTVSISMAFKFDLKANS